MKKKLIIIGIIIVVIIGGIILVGKGNGAILAEKVKMDTEFVKRSVAAAGTTKSVNEADLALPTTGILQQISINEGDFVAVGQSLASLANYDTAQTALAYKEAADVARKDLAIYIENYQNEVNDVGGQDEYDLGVRRLKDLVSKAEASYNSALGSLDKTTLEAPFAGTIVDSFFVKGEVVVAGTTIVKLADLSQLFFEISVDQEDIGLVKIGQEVEITLDSYEDNVYTGVVKSLPKYADSTTEEFIVEIVINQTAENPVLLGMIGDADIIIERTEVAVPALAFDEIFVEDGESYVWINENGMLKRMVIETGLEGDIYTEVKTDLTGKEIVIPEDLDEAYEGAKVRFNGKNGK